MQGFLESMRDYQRMAPQRLSDANLESILWNKVPVKLQKEVGQMTEDSWLELFQKLLKAEETIKDLITKIQKGESFKASLRGLVTGMMEKQITHQWRSYH